MSPQRAQRSRRAFRLAVRAPLCVAATGVWFTASGYNYCCDNRCFGLKFLRRLVRSVEYLF